jgi:hypothetical protein
MSLLLTAFAGIVIAVSDVDLGKARSHAKPLSTSIPVDTL